MSVDVEIKLRGPEAYSLARKTLEAMETHKVWPTPLNFELWAHVLIDPNGPLALEINRRLSTGEAFTDGLSDELAQAFLPRSKLNEQIADAGDALTKELASVSRAIQSAQESSQAYGQTLASASESLNTSDVTDLRNMVETLQAATKRVQRENSSLENRLADSTSEVTRLRDHLEQVRRDATTDGLTNLANRRAFDEELERACVEADSKGTPLNLAILDIDHFKRFNDTWGHQTGDQVLRYVASVIGSKAAAPRFSARYGGEEFALLFPGDGAGVAEMVLNEILTEVSSRALKRRSTNDDLGIVTVSAGVALRRPAESAHNFLERADAALYDAKRTGRNRVCTAEAIAAAA